MSIDWTIDPALGAREGWVEVDGGRTWYAIVGDEAAERAAGKAPLLLLHGGPGAAHDYLESMAALAATGRRVVFYDQQGCGNSDQPDDPARWTVDFYVRELATVRRALGLERCHILGQSWGGMLLMEYLVTRPAGVVSATIASSPASMPMWITATARQRAALPEPVIATLARHEAAGTWDDPEYEAAVTVFYDRHLCRVVPNPEFVTRSFAKLARNPQVYRTMNGPTEFHVVGTLRDWEVLTRLAKVDEPVLLTSGRYDEATPDQMIRIVEALPQAEWVLFEQSGHLSHAEEPDRYMAAVADFLARAEGGKVRRGGGHDQTSASIVAGNDPRSAGSGNLTGLPGSP
ncbi:MAG: proline iminopeptidase-family hydrolase [Candidatus Limnocylindrales bacterium]